MRRVLVILSAWSLATCDSPRVDDAHEASLQARAKLRAGRWAEAIDELKASADAHERNDDLRASVRDRQARAYTLIYSAFRLDEARRALDAAEPNVSVDPELRATQPYYRGLLALESGDYRGAVEQMRRAQARFIQLDMTNLVAAAGEVEVAALSGLGDRRQVELRLEHLESARHVDRCTQARHDNNVGWLRLLSADATSSAVDPTLVTTLESVVRSFDDELCGGGRSAATARVHLGLAQLLAGAPARALEALAGLGTLPPDVAYWRAEVEGRAHLALGNLVGAEATLEGAQGIARRHAMVDADWRATTFLGDTVDRIGDTNRALSIYAEAERRLDDRSLDVPIGRGRTGFLVDRLTSARRLASLLVRDDRADEAACVLRLANRRRRARAARSGRIGRLTGERRLEWEDRIGTYRRESRALEAERRADWDRPVDERRRREDQRAERMAAAERGLDAALALIERATERVTSCEQLAAPAADETLLVIDRLDQRRAVVFAVGQDTMATIVDDLSHAAVESVLQQLDLKRAIKVLPTATSAHLDVHTMMVAGQPLAATHRVVYTLDLDAAGQPSAATRALVVGNPKRNLRAAGHEATVVADRLSTFGLSVERRFGRGADLRTVRRAIESADVFHFAGHGRASNVGPFDDRIELADGALSVADVLTLDHVPSHVVLSGCRTGRVDDRGVDLATAFVLAGSHVVVASTRDVIDAVDFGAAMYGAGEDFDLIEAYQRAAAQSVPGWSAFRVWVR